MGDSILDQIVTTVPEKKKRRKIHRLDRLALGGVIADRLRCREDLRQVLAQEGMGSISIHRDQAVRIRPFKIDFDSSIRFFAIAE